MILTPTFHYPKITNRQPIAIYGKERKVFVLFRYFRVATTFEPASGGRLNCNNMLIALLQNVFPADTVGSRWFSEFPFFLM
jgi:hypothetical protein